MATSPPGGAAQRAGRGQGYPAMRGQRRTVPGGRGQRHRPGGAPGGAGTGLPGAPGGSGLVGGFSWPTSGIAAGRGLQVC